MMTIVLPSRGASALASVGTGTGKIRIDSPLEAGTSKTLDSIAVYNDGDEPGSYGMEVMFNETQPELKPKKEWITFYPKSFDLGPGESKIVKVVMDIPRDAKPGQYFSYLESHLLKVATIKNSHHANIGAAAATKLLFSISKQKETINPTISIPNDEPDYIFAPLSFERMSDFFISSSQTMNKQL